MSNLIDLCLLADVKTWLGLTSTNDDNLLSSLITNVSQRILSILQRDAIVSAAYTETYDGTGTPSLALLHYPVTGVTSLTINDAPIVASPDGVVSGYVFDKFSLKLVGSCAAWALQPGVFGAPYTFIKGSQNVVVKYTAGYAAVPFDLAEAAKDWVAFRYRQKGWIGIKSKHISTGESVTLDGGAVPDFVREALHPYKRLIPV